LHGGCSFEQGCIVTIQQYGMITILDEEFSSGFANSARTARN
jgi:hypothetical protein